MVRQGSGPDALRAAPGSPFGLVCWAPEYNAISMHGAAANGNAQSCGNDTLSIPEEEYVSSSRWSANAAIQLEITSISSVTRNVKKSGAKLTP